MKAGMRTGALTVLAGTLFLGSSKQSHAMINIGGGWYCQTMEVMHQYQGMTCEYYGEPGGGGGGYSGGYGGGGGGGSIASNLADRAISAKLQCALDQYLHANIALSGGRTMKKVNAWAFGKKNAYGVWGYATRGTNVSPGADWVPVDGITSPGSLYGRLYKGAFLASNNVTIIGSRPGATQNRLQGAISAFEKSLLVAAHEASHLLGNSDEPTAEWYGVDAVLKYRADKGSKCADKPN